MNNWKAYLRLSIISGILTVVTLVLTLILALTFTAHDTFYTISGVTLITMMVASILLLQRSMEGFFISYRKYKQELWANKGE